MSARKWKLRLAIVVTFPLDLLVGVLRAIDDAIVQAIEDWNAMDYLVERTKREYPPKVSAGLPGIKG